MAVSQMILRIDRSRRDKLKRLSRQEDKTVSELLRELIDGFIREHDIAGHLDALWGRIGRKAASKGFAAGDVDRVIRETRKA